ncbi:glutathione S-transferase family protein [Swaminathania salitolerans]|nr:glutathione binding-like protein [Swaminathania salitolerans]
MYELYAFATPNSVKVTIALEELGLPYTLHGINIRQGEQGGASFIALNPNGKVPVLIDRDAGGEKLLLTESAAILVHLAEKTGRLLPTDAPARARVFEQLFFHASALSPAFGQAGFFRRFASETLPLAIERFDNEARRVLGVLDGVLAHRDFVAGNAFSIADIAHFGWLWRRSFPGIALDRTPHVARWYEQIAARPGVQRGIDRVEALTARN